FGARIIGGDYCIVGELRGHLTLGSAPGRILISPRPENHDQLIAANRPQGPQNVLERMARVREIHENGKGLRGGHSLQAARHTGELADAMASRFRGTTGAESHSCGGGDIEKAESTGNLGLHLERAM